MPRKRLFIETPERIKNALLATTETQGISLAHWVEEQVTASVPDASRTWPDDALELTHWDQPNGMDGTIRDLATQDWAFTHDDTSYLTHDLHPYPGKFIPQIPANLISRLSVRGDVVLDPFGGSATTAVEAVRLRRRAVSLDANPLSSLIGRVKTGFMNPDVRSDLAQLIATVEGHLISPDALHPEWSQALMSRHREYIPDIPNRTKWFCDDVTGELALLRFLIDQTTRDLARDAALVALSRIVIRVSNQDSETRYVSVSKAIGPKLTLRAYLESLKTVMRRLENAAVVLQYADARFMTIDSRQDLVSTIGENSVDLIVTSPPYPNATDYHLYHRFRLFWLGFDPRELGRIEIGSHLRHQRNRSGFEEYLKDMRLALAGCAEVLQPARYAVFIVGDALFKGEIFSTADAISDAGRAVGLSLVAAIDRPVHMTKRSFAKAGRRTRAERLIILKKPERRISVLLNPPAYLMWPFEQTLRQREIAKLTNTTAVAGDASRPISLKVAQPALWNLRRLTYTKDFVVGNAKGAAQPTWQKVIENGDSEAVRRKDPKYATHGLHPFKGKFYPQLAKSLLNISGAPFGGRLLDPYCGSGTTLLEGMLNGFQAFGCDFNPLAAKIARAKTSILCVPRDVADLAMRALLDQLSRRRGEPPRALNNFAPATHEELRRWFPDRVLWQINWLLGQARLFGDPALVEFFEILTSSLIRDVSQQDPTDLRIRRRKEPIEDAPVLELFRERLERQHHRLLKYWAVAGRQPGKLTAPIVVQGDSRHAESMSALGLASNSVDCVVTSPPYATALPYIDTDRLSLLAVMGLTASTRSGIEENLTGSREIKGALKRKYEAEIQRDDAGAELPTSVVDFVRRIRSANQTDDVGFRRANMAALLWRYFLDMRCNFSQVFRVLKPGSPAFYIVGDSRTNAGGEWTAIATCDHLRSIGEMVGFRVQDTLSIDVTREKYKHMKNAIAVNQILTFTKP